MDETGEFLELIRQCRAAMDGDPEALARLDRLLGRVYSFLFIRARGFCRSEADLLDVLQETLVDIVSDIKKFRGETVGEFLSWCRRIAWCRAAEHYRSWWPRRVRPLTPEEIQALRQAATESDTGSESDDRLERVLMAMNRLPGKCRENLVLFYLHETGDEELGHIFRKTPDAVRVARGRCLAKLRKLLKL